MNTPNDGGPAFPRYGTGRFSSCQDGMSLRDWFAGMALQGMIANHGWTVSQGVNTAKVAYEYADEMLKSREKSNERSS